MTRTVFSPSAMARAALLGGAALLLSAAQDAPATQPPVPAAPVAVEAQQPVFEDAFAQFEDLPAEVAIPDHAVDLDTIETPIEAEARGRAIAGGKASYYGRRFHGRKTANGERFNMRAMTAAHKTLPFGTKVRVTNARNGKSVIVRINDRGPFVRGRVIDLSRGAAERIGMIRSGHANVRLEIVS